MSQVKEIVLKIEGMSCGHCTSAVEKALREVNGVVEVKVDLAKKEAVVTGSADYTELVTAIEDTGFTVVRLES